MITPANRVQFFNLLDHEQVDSIHHATLHILETLGLRMPLAPERYEQLEGKGARVDRETGQVFFTGNMVASALESSPKKYTLYARNGEDHFTLDGTKSHLTLDGTGLEVLDRVTGEARTSTFEDLCHATRLGDALDQISFLWPAVGARDRPASLQPLYEFYAMVKNSGKHIQAMTAVDPGNARGTVAMAAEIAGGPESLREEPIISNFQCSVSPLAYDGDSLEAALVFAEAGIPVGFMNMSIGCATAPATLAGHLALVNAEILGGITFHQSFFPGAPVFYGTCATLMDMKTGSITAGGPYDCLLQAASARIARHYGLPSCIGTFATGARGSDWQAGVENTLSGAASILCGADMVCGAGLIRGAKVFSTAQLILDCEIFDMIRHFSAGIEVNDETLALDAINRVGAGNHFMIDENTRKHMRSFWRPSCIDNSPGEQQAPRVGSLPEDLARKKADDLLAKLEPPELKGEKAVLDIIEEFEHTRNSEI